MFRDVLWEVRAAPSNFAIHDLSEIFANTRELVFIDYCHTTESANARIASAIAVDVAVVLQTLRSIQSAPKDGEPIRGSRTPGLLRD